LSFDLGSASQQSDSVAPTGKLLLTLGPSTVPNPRPHGASRNRCSNIIQARPPTTAGLQLRAQHDPAVDQYVADAVERFGKRMMKTCAGRVVINIMHRKTLELPP
jgi:hypothetical protein